jgi:N-acetylmuramoyl-L-alanine amidase
MKFLRSIVAILFAGIVMLLYANFEVHTSAQTLLGSIGNIETPTNGSTMMGQSSISGWFLDGNGVSKVDVLVDGADVGQATLGDARPDVQKAFPDYNNGNAGFHFTFDTTQFSDGQHTVTVRETSTNGSTVTLSPRTVNISNVKFSVESPVAGTTLSGTKTVSGWFLDSSGVAKIDVLVDGAVAGQATLGDARPDVQKAFPDFNNGNAGFHFALDTTKYSSGQHTVAFKETGSNGKVTILPPTTVNIIANVKGYMESPVAGSNLSGTKTVSGWFLDDNGVAKIDVLVDGSIAGQATLGDARPDVQKAFPDFNNANAGFHFALDTTKYSDGQHTVAIRETSSNGQVTTLPSTSVNMIANVKGYMESPVSGTTMSGTKTVSGWFLDDSGVAKIEVLVDGTVAGQATLGDARPDVQKAFPDFNNGNAGFHFALDTSQYSDGQHTVAIRETGTNGRVTTLAGSTIKFTTNVKGSMDAPLSGSTISGTENVSGWFLDDSGVAKIEVLVDGNIAGQATYGDARPDVQKVFPDFNNGNAGFHFALDTSQYSDGQHTITIRETGKNGRVTVLPGNTVKIVSNIQGYMDNPVFGSTLRGTVNVSGWLLDIIGVNKIEVLVDNTVAGQAAYGDARPDVQKAYPDFNNGNAGYHFALDTTQYTSGQHTVTIKETRANGQVITLPAVNVTISQSVSVFLDPGHGGTDPGATAGGYQEKNLNLAVAKKVQALLQARGYTVYMSRIDDSTVGLLDRSIMANNLHADIFVSIHTNSAGVPETSANGIETYFYQYDPLYPSKINAGMDTNPDRIAKSVALANYIQQNLVSYTGANDRGTKGDTLSVVRESAMPAILTEIGFIDNTAERQKLITDAYQNTLATAIANGIDKYFSVY